MNSGQIVKDLLDERGIKQTWVAEQLKIKQSTLCIALSKDLPFTLLIDICDLIKVPINTIYDKYQEKKILTASAKNPSVSKSTKLHK